MEQAATTKKPAKATPAAPGKPGQSPAKTSPMELVTYEILSCTPRIPHAAAGATAADSATDADPDVFDIVLCNATPVDRGYARLTWLMKKSACDMSYAKNGLSLLLEHGARTADQLYSGMIDPTYHIGIIEELEVDEAKEQLVGAMRFSRSALAQEIKRDVQDRTRRFVSAALIKLKWKLTKAASTPDELDEYLVTRWRPVEGSIVSVPAIPTALIKNSAAGQMEYPVELESDTTEPEVITMNAQEKAAAEAAAAAAAAAANVPAATATIERQNLGGGGGASRAEIDAAVTSRNKQIAEIVKLCNDQGVSVKAGDFIERGLTVEQAGLEILRGKVSDGTVKGVAAEVREGLGKERKRWSLCRALEQLCLQREGKGSIDGVEGEVHQHVEKRAIQMGLATHGGLFIAHDLRELGDHDPNLRGIERQTMVSNVAAKGGEFVLDSPGGFIDLLRASSIGAQLGAQVMTDLVGNVPFAKQTSDVVVSFVGENPASGVAATDMGTGQVTLSAKTMQGRAIATRQLLRLASYSYEDKLQNSFANAHALAFDRQGFHGSGAAGQCTGIYAAPDVGAVAMGAVAPSWAKITDMIAAVAVQNAHAGRIGFASSTQLAGRLKNQVKSTAAVSPFVWEGRIDDGNIDGYRALASTQIAANLGAAADEHGFIFGNFAELVYGMWGGLEIVVDNVTGAPSGLVSFISFQMGDVILLHGQSFCKATGAKLG